MEKYGADNKFYASLLGLHRLRNELGKADLIQISANLQQFFSAAPAKSSMKALTEILALFLNSSKGSETIAQGFGVSEQKLRPFMELCMSSWTNQQE